jgi:predicted ATPase/DNA-binding XRE family transcriptional regulator
MVEAQTSQFGEHLRRLRETAGLSQEELAERAGLSPAAVSALERGHRRNPYPQTIRALSDALGLSGEDRQALQTAARKQPEAQPARSPIEPAHRLPSPVGSLVGRDQEIDDLRRLLTSETVRLVTLTGPGGTGKTRLALEVAPLLGDAFPDGVAFVSLAAVQSPDLVIPAIAEAIGVRDTGGMALPERLRHALRDRRVLLVLDNLEHLPGAATPVAELIRICQQVSVLATSRAPLRLSGEHEYPVPPLSAPTGSGQLSIQDVTANDAVALFVQRAQGVVPDFRLNESNVAAVAEICARLDGLPLAIELAAARVKVLQPAALLERLGSGLGLLTGGPRDQVARLQSLRAAVAWSYDLLDPEERSMFRRLSVFADGFSLEAAEAVTVGGDSRPALPVLDGVASLVDKSLLRRVESVTGEPRFGMLETIREYGLEQLEAAGEGDDARGAHAAWFIDLAEEAWPSFRRRAGHEAWLDRLEGERGNLRAVMTWLDERGDVDSLLQLTGALYWLWYVRGPLSEGRFWLERSLNAEGAEAAGMTRLRALVGVGQVSHFQGDDDQAVFWLEASIALSKELEDTWWLALALGILGAVAEDHGDYAGAETKFSAALDLFRAADDGANSAASLVHLGIVAWGQGDAKRAIERYEEAAALQRDVGDNWGLSNSLAYLSLLATEQSDHARAANLGRDSLALRWTLKAWEDVAGSLADFGSLAAAADRPERAALLLGAAAALREEAARSAPNLPERAVYENAAARAHEALGDDLFAQTDAAGRALSIDQAITEAFAVADEIVWFEEASAQTQR